MPKIFSQCFTAQPSRSEQNAQVRSSTFMSRIKQAVKSTFSRSRVTEPAQHTDLQNATQKSHIGECIRLAIPPPNAPSLTRSLSTQSLNSPFPEASNSPSVELGTSQTGAAVDSMKPPIFNQNDQTSEPEKPKRQPNWPSEKVDALHIEVVTLLSELSRLSELPLLSEKQCAKALDIIQRSVELNNAVSAPGTLNEHRFSKLRPNENKNFKELVVKVLNTLEVNKSLNRNKLASAKTTEAEKMTLAINVSFRSQEPRRRVSPAQFTQDYLAQSKVSTIQESTMKIVNRESPDVVVSKQLLKILTPKARTTRKTRKRTTCSEYASSIKSSVLYERSTGESTS